MSTLILSALLLMAASVSAADNTQVIYGWVEHGIILPNSIPLEMKFDTGAKSSSVDANGIELYEKDNTQWVRFNIDIEGTDSDKPRSVQYDLPVIRKVKISGAGGEVHRVVVLMDICIDGHSLKKEEFTLANRSNKQYPVLIGRSTLQHLGALVDSSKKFIRSGKCST